jgi:hypothetical protein
MSCFSKTFRSGLFILVTFLFWGCADSGQRFDQLGQKFDQLKDDFLKQSDLPEPIATSVDEMPDDTAVVATAIQRWITERRLPLNVKFEDKAADGYDVDWFAKEGFIQTGTQLYSYDPKAHEPHEKSMSGRMDFECPWGRRASLRYDVRYRTTGNIIVIKELHASPIYSNTPEPLLFLVAFEAIPRDSGGYPSTYGEMLQFVGECAVRPDKPTSVSMEANDYLIFVIIPDQVSPSAKLQVKLSDKHDGIYGYEMATRYTNYNNWLMAILPARLTLFGNTDSSSLFVKVVFTPGNDVGILRRTPRKIGLFTISGASPKS